MNRWFKWDPGADTVFAVASDVAMWAIYFTNSHMSPDNALGRLVVFVLAGTLFLDVILPAWYVLRVRRESLSELGITTNRWEVALLTSLVLCLMLVPGLHQAINDHPGLNLVPHLIYSGIILWEPFFVFSWLQLRFERAFGIIPGIALAAVGIAVYHIGTYPVQVIAAMVIFGIVDSAAFRISRNLLSMFPFTWAMASGIGTLQGGMVFGWDVVALYGVILAIQIAAIAIMSRSAGSTVLQGSPA
ncbi:MAG: hypothetical protein ACLQDV_14005 [Candidatus Binataceae bacterium]